MAKYLCSVIILSLIIISTGSFAEEPREVIFTHYGHACFMITTSHQTRVLTDPMKLEGYSIPDSANPDVITVSHRHIDHDNIAGVSGQPLVFYGVNGPMNKGLQHKFIPIDTQVNDVRIYDVACNHFNPVKSPIPNSIFVFEFDGIRVAHLGDLGFDLSEDARAQIGAIDILMIPVGGIYTLSLDEVDEAITQLKPRMVVLPMHFKTEAAPFLANTAEDFLKDKDNVKRISGDTYTLDPGNPPQEMEYVILNTSGE